MDAVDSTLYVEKEGEPPGPAQAAFKGLIPGKTITAGVPDSDFCCERATILIAGACMKWPPICN
jgi:hypothetical protein